MQDMIKSLLVLALFLGISYVLLSQAAITGLSVFEQPKVDSPQPSLVLEEENLVACCVIDPSEVPPRYCRVQEGFDCGLCEEFCDQ